MPHQPPDRPTDTTPQQELSALTRIAKILATLDETAAVRTIRWLADRYDIESLDLP